MSADEELNTILDEIARGMTELHRVGNDLVSAGHVPFGLFMRDPLRDEYCVVTPARIKREFIRLHPTRYLAHAHAFAKRWADLTQDNALTVDIPTCAMLVRYGTNGRLYGQRPGLSGLGSLILVKPQTMHAIGLIDVDALLWDDALALYTAADARGTAYRAWRDILPLMFATYTTIAPDALRIIWDYTDREEGCVIIGAISCSRSWMAPSAYASHMRSIVVPDCPVAY